MTNRQKYVFFSALDDPQLEFLVNEPEKDSPTPLIESRKNGVLYSVSRSKSKAALNLIPICSWSKAARHSSFEAPIGDSHAFQATLKKLLNV